MRGLDAAARFGGDGGQLAGFAERQRQLALAPLQPLHHLRERIDQDADFIGPQGLVGGTEIAMLDAIGGAGELGERVEHDFLGREHQPHHHQHRGHEDACENREEELAAASQELLRLVRQLALATVKIRQKGVDWREITFAHRQQRFSGLRSIDLAGPGGGPFIELRLQLLEPLALLGVLDQGGLMREVVVDRGAFCNQALVDRGQREHHNVMLIVLELDERSPQRSVDVEDFAEPFAVRILIGREIQCKEEEPDRARDQDGDQPQGEERAGTDLHGWSLLTMSFTC